LFSATFSDIVIEKIATFIGDLNAFPVKKETLKLKGVKNFKMTMSEAEKLDFVTNLYNKLDKSMAMIFVNTKKTAENLNERLRQNTIKSRMLIGKMDQKERDTTLDAFRNNEFPALICTNVLARGIDVPEVDIVINYDVPVTQDQTQWKEPDYANFMHRVGRTGRFGTDGIALTFITKNDENEPEYVKKIEEYYEIQLTQLTSFE